MATDYPAPRPSIACSDCKKSKASITHCVDDVFRCRACEGKRKAALPEATEESVEKIINAAQAHGDESEPEHAVGDLEQALRVCWKFLDAEARREVLGSSEVQDVLEWLS